MQAPAGYGKTTLLAQWREVALRRGARVAWIGLERSDRTAERLVATIVSALAHAGVDVPDDLLNGTAQWRPDSFLEALLRHCERRPAETWLMLDDWHAAESEEIAALLDRMLRRMPGDWHVALSSRSRPGLNLLSHRAQGQLLELGQDELRFSLGETRSLIGTGTLPEPALAELAQITEGWPIALQLSQLWLSNDGVLEALRSSFIGSIDGMADYLAAEVFATLPPDLRDFLIDTSICPRFNSDLADRVRQRSDSAGLMGSLKALHGLAIPLDGRRLWYRHHRIFAEFLDGERRRLPEARLAILHRCAADWFEREGLLFEAVEHARSSGDDARALAMIEGTGCVDVCIRSGAPAVKVLLDSVPAELVHQRPRLRTAHAALDLKRGSIAQAGRALAELQVVADVDGADPAFRRDLTIVTSLRECFVDGIPSLGDLADHRRSMESLAGAEWWVTGLLQNVQGRLELRRGLIADAVRSLARADATFERGGSAHGHFFMLANMAVCRLFLGQLAAAKAELGEARLVLAQGLDAADSYAGVTQTVEATLLYERNELAAAGRAAELAFAGLEQAEGCFEQYFLSTLVAARTAMVTEGLDAALHMVKRGRRLATYHGLSRVNGLLDCLHARMLVDAERWAEAAQLVEASDFASAAGDGGWLESDHVIPVYCLLALHSGDAERARALAVTMAARCRDGGRVPAEVRAHLLTALAAAENGHAARRALRDAVRSATDETIRQPFFEHGSPILPMLRDLHASDEITLTKAEADFLADLILRLEATAKAQAHVERLTTRERDILVHLRQGRSNKMIARDLDLSENAVKFHMKNVFRKLEVDNRAMAAAVAQRLP